MARNFTQKALSLVRSRQMDGIVSFNQSLTISRSFAKAKDQKGAKKVEDEDPNKKETEKLTKFYETALEAAE